MHTLEGLKSLFSWPLLTKEGVTLDMVARGTESWVYNHLGDIHGGPRGNVQNLLIAFGINPKILVASCG